MKYLIILKNIPRPVAISMAVIAGALGLFLIVFIFLGGTQDREIDENARLKAELDQVTKSLNLSQGDYRFLSQNAAKYESILQTDRLVPHTRLNAVRQLDVIGRQRGLTSLNYSFASAPAQSAEAVKSQPTTGGYRVSVENIVLQVGAPLDTQIYGVMLDLAESFPGSAVIQSFSLHRTPSLSTADLEQLSHGLGQSLVSGEIRVVWRTAQANEPEGQKK